jgi:TM2 domain-containing membrane protein YozV
MIGLHQFYMGRRRRALWYLAFAWSGFPIVLGWIDAVRLALLTEAQFQAAGNNFRLTSGAQAHPYSPRHRAKREYEPRRFSGPRKPAADGQRRRGAGGQREIGGSRGLHPTSA